MAFQLGERKACGAVEEEACSPDIQLLIKHEVVIEVGDGSVHSIAIYHLHHSCSRLAFHEFHLSKDTQLYLYTKPKPPHAPQNPLKVQY